jgi:hypothetical protein
MFTAFAIQGVPMLSDDDWGRHVANTPLKERDKLVDVLRSDPLEGAKHPNFSRAGTGMTLLEWARGKGAQYTLLLIVRHA